MQPKQVAAAIDLLNAGATIPFIARYRKEATASLDEVQLDDVSTALDKLKALEKRKETVLATLTELKQLTPELKQRIAETWDANVLEDLYLPFKPKRKTRASAARELGLEPLAGALMKQQLNNVMGMAGKFVKGAVKDAEAALQGARDIMAEWVTERAAARNAMRQVFGRNAIITSKVIKGKDAEGEKYRDYFKFSEQLKRIPSHRLMAIRRGEAEGILRVSIAPEESHALERLERLFVKGRGADSEQVQMAVKDAYKRLLGPSIETEFRNASKEKADAQAIEVFAENLRQLLLAPPLGQKVILAIDPGFRTGCKVVVIDAQGNLKHNETIYPHGGDQRYDKGGNYKEKAASKIAWMVKAFHVEAIAIGNGTAGRETDTFIRERLHLPREVQLFMVNEAGASVYSASPIAREEFPNYDITVRGSVSIGRRLMDPLAELVKIDPKSIGVGQYQHDVDQAALKAGLDRVVEHCVNLVGVNLNTASKHLLTYVSGLGPKLAASITDYRAEHGAFDARKQLLKVPGLGPKAYEQCAGFLRIPNGSQPLDNSAVHPERYSLVQKMARDLGVDIGTLLADPKHTERIELQCYVGNDVGLPTLKDIVAELAKPGRDPRGKAQTFSFAQGIRSMDDLREGLILPGLVTNLTKFGAFVDVGAKQDGLVHVSELANRYISDPAEVVKLGQAVKVKVLEVDAKRKRVALSIKQAETG